MTIALSAALAAASSALAQSGRRWVDPPAELGTPSESTQPAQPESAPAAPPSPEPGASVAAPPSPPLPDPPGEPAPPVRSAAPGRPAPAPADAGPAALAERPATAQDLVAAREEAARDLLIDYLDLWSSQNPLALTGSVELYGPNVIFHGRAMDARALREEKRRFVQRWPERRYRPRPDTIGVACGPGAETCTVRSVFDFLAADPGRGRRSQGVATLELVVAFGADGRPMIVAEDSIVHGRSRARVSARSDDDDDVP